MPALSQAKTTLISPDNLVIIGRDNTLKNTTIKKIISRQTHTLMGINKIRGYYV